MFKVEANLVSAFLFSGKLLSVIRNLLSVLYLLNTSKLMKLKN